MKTFTNKELKELLPNWNLIDGFITKNYSFKDFKTAFAFMEKVAILAEEQNHHPDWTNCYNKLVIKLVTHDHNKITEKDILLAKAIDSLSLIN